MPLKKITTNCIRNQEGFNYIFILSSNLGDPLPGPFLVLKNKIGKSFYCSINVSNLFMRVSYSDYENSGLGISK
jgi:hypothetical protein